MRLIRKFRKKKNLSDEEQRKVEFFMKKIEVLAGELDTLTFGL